MMNILIACERYCCLVVLQDGQDSIAILQNRCICHTISSTTSRSDFKQVHLVACFHSWHPLSTKHLEATTFVICLTWTSAIILHLHARQPCCPTLIHAPDTIGQGEVTNPPLSGDVADVVDGVKKLRVRKNADSFKCGNGTWQNPGLHAVLKAKKPILEQTARETWG
jgi:hypothetical protein